MCSEDGAKTGVDVDLHPFLIGHYAVASTSTRPCAHHLAPGGVARHEGEIADWYRKTTFGLMKLTLGLPAKFIAPDLRLRIVYQRTFLMRKAHQTSSRAAPLNQAAARLLPMDALYACARGHP
jgi:hypothetical protein